MARNEDSKNSVEFHVISLEDQIGTAIRSALTETEQDSGAKFDDNLLVEVARAVVYHVGFEGDMAYAYEDVIAESIAAFAGHTVEERNLALLTEVIRSVVEPFVSNRNDYYDFTIEEDDGDGSENIDQIANESGPQDTGMRARKRQLNMNDSIATTSNNNSSQNSTAAEEEDDDDAEDQDRVNEWMEQVMAKSEQEYLQEESDYGDVAPDEQNTELSVHKSPLRSDKEFSSSASDSEREVSVNRSVNHSVDQSGTSRSFERPLYHLTSSDDDTLHSEDSIERKKTSKEHQFQSPAPYQIRKSAAAIYEAAEEEKEPLPAWLMPKSPLDAHFRKGYGGLGKDDLQETIELITSTQKKALRASRIADEHEESSAAASSADEEGDSSNEERSRNTDAGEIDEPVPAWLIPKSPLDAHFRKGYGGLGKVDLQDAIEEITTAQKLARKHIHASQQQQEPDEFDVLNAITVDDLPHNFGSSDAAVGTPTQVRPTRRLGSSESKNGSGGSRAKGTEYAKQQKLFQSPKPSRIPVAVSSAKKHGTPHKSASEEPLPAWLIPKSPLDAHFRKGYGGLGHEDLNEAIAEVTSSQKKAQRATIASLQADQSTKSIMRMLENYYDTRDGKDGKASAKSPAAAVKKASATKAKKGVAKKEDGAVGETSESIMFDVDGAEEEKFSYIDAIAQLADVNAEDLLPSSHPSTSPPSALTNNPSLNAMMRDSFNTYVSKYAKSSAPRAAEASSQGKTSRAATPQSTKKKISANLPGVSSDAKPAKAALTEENFAAYLRSPELKHNFDEIDALIRESQRNLRRMKIGEKNEKNEKKVKKTRSSSFVSAVSLTDHESQEAQAPRPKGRKVPRAKLTKRADAYALPVGKAAAKPAAPVKTVNAKAQKQSTAKLHEQVTGNVRRSSVTSIVTAPISWSRRSSTTTMASKISQTLLNEGPVRLPSPSPRLSRSQSPALLRRSASAPKSRARTPPATHNAATATAPQRLLSSNSRLLVPTAAALIRSADIASNSSKAANIHNEWHTLLRSENPYGESDVELSGRKLRNKLLRRSLPAVNAEQIMEWSSPDKKSKSVDFLYGLRGALSAEEAAYLSSPHGAAVGGAGGVAGSPAKRRSSTPTYIAPLPSSSRLTVPTVTSVMRSLVTAQQSPVIRRLERTVHNKPSKTYLLHGDKLAKKLTQAQEKLDKAGKKKKATKKRKSSAARV